MIKDLYKQLASQDDLKPVLAELKTVLKNDADRELAVLSEEELISFIDRLNGLLNDTDPKIRKNSVYCLGCIGQAIQESDKGASALIADNVYEAYCHEQTKYNMAAYIEALGRLDFSSVKDKLTARQKELCEADFSDEDKKHVIEEMRELNRILRKDTEKKHEFTGYDLVNEATLLTNRNFKNITIEELGKIPHKEFNAGVMVKTRNIGKVLESRTFSELLFVPDVDAEQDKICEKGPVLSNLGDYASNLIRNGLTGYIAARHSESDSPFYFRVEVKCRDEKRKGDYEKKLAAELEFYSHWKLINSPGDYDLEFRFIESSSGKLQFMIGMRTFPDRRFDYRKSVISAGMKPNLAALLVRLSKDYISDNAAVLDPVCGSGVFLIEREMYRPARILYGIDIFGEAVKASQENVKAAGIAHKCELITRDFLEFRHQYRFNEIYADMPRITAGKDSEKIEKFYMGFMNRAKELLEEDGHLFVYTHNKNILKRYSQKYGYSIIKEFEISKIEEAYYYILGR